MKRLITFLLVLLLIASLAAPAWADDVLYCRMCGKSIPTDSKFCCYCGEAVVKPESSSGSTAAASAEPSAKTVVVAEPIADVKTATSGPFNTVGTQQVSSGRITVTKSPTSESVPYGGSAIFIARALNHTGITWYIANGDASTVYNVSDAPHYISGLTVYGQGTETLTLCGIPSWLNGWKVQAAFSGEGGPVYSDVAYIWTYQQVVTYYEPIYIECYDPCDYFCPYDWPDYGPPPPEPPPAPCPPVEPPPPPPNEGYEPQPVPAGGPQQPQGGNPPPPNQFMASAPEAPESGDGFVEVASMSLGSPSDEEIVES